MSLRLFARLPHSAPRQAEGVLAYGRSDFQCHLCSFSIAASSPCFARYRRKHLLAHGPGAYNPLVTHPDVVQESRGARRLVALRQAALRLVDAWALVRPPCPEGPGLNLKGLPEMRLRSVIATTEI